MFTTPVQPPRGRLPASILSLEVFVVAKSEITRRAFVGSMAVAGLPAAETGGWVELFNGHSLEGWRPSESQASWKVVDGQLAAGRAALASLLHRSGAERRFPQLRAGSRSHGAAPGVTPASISTLPSRSRVSPRKALRSRSTTPLPGKGTTANARRPVRSTALRNIYKQLVPDDTGSSCTWPCAARISRSG